MLEIQNLAPKFVRQTVRSCFSLGAFRLLFVVLCICTVGCKASVTRPVGGQRYVEFFDEREDLKLTVNSSGFARVEVKRDDAADDTVVIPVVVAEASRLFGLASQVLPLSQEQVYDGRRLSPTACYLSVGDVAQIYSATFYGEPRQNLVLKGLIEEIKFVSCSELARAVSYHKRALLQCKERNWQSALGWYDKALSAIDVWHTSVSKRFAAIYEFRGSFRVGDHTISYQTLPTSSQIRNQFGYMTEEMTVELLEQVWERLTYELEFNEEENAVLVQFKGSLRTQGGVVRQDVLHLDWGQTKRARRKGT
jgi:hypothetical protein